MSQKNNKLTTVDDAQKQRHRIRRYILVNGHKQLVTVSSDRSPDDSSDDTNGTVASDAGDSSGGESTAGSSDDDASGNGNAGPNNNQANNGDNGSPDNDQANNGDNGSPDNNQADNGGNSGDNKSGSTTSDDSNQGADGNSGPTLGDNTVQSSSSLDSSPPRDRRCLRLQEQRPGLLRRPRRRTLVSPDGQIALVVSDNQVRASVKGKGIVWEFPLTFPDLAVCWAPTDSPIYRRMGPIVYFTTGNSVRCVGGRDGEMLWSSTLKAAGPGANR